MFAPTVGQVISPLRTLPFMTIGFFDDPFRYANPASRKNGSYFSSLSRGLHRAKRGVRVPDGSPESLQAVGAYLPITFEYCRIRPPSGRAYFDDSSLLFFRLHVTIFP
jgi:hypothetical protein